MSSKVKNNLLGKTFDRLTVIRRSERRPGVFWDCLCACGRSATVLSGRLLSGKTRSCGCLRREVTASRNERGPNYFRVISDVAYLYLTDTRGVFVEKAKIDASDVDLVSGIRWHFHPAGYAAASSKKFKGSLHRFIVGPENGLHVDHANGDRLDNRRSNLRTALPSQNCYNRLLLTGRDFKGVYRRHLAGGVKYMAQIKHNGASIYLGLYDSPISAALAYDKKAVELFGEFAAINFPL